MKDMHFPEVFITMIGTCLSLVSYSIKLKGSSGGFFNAGRGVMQGDPLSPYLFELCIEALTQLLNRGTDTGRIKYHPNCIKVPLTDLCFADDLLIFSNASSTSLQGIEEFMESFYIMSWLKVSYNKSENFYFRVDSSSQQQLANLVGLKVTKQPVRYLGVPLIAGKLRVSDYQPLIDKITSRISSWSSRFLSFAGRLQLKDSVLFSITNYWSSTFILPTKVIRNIEQLCSSFLWKDKATLLLGPKFNGS